MHTEPRGQGGLPWHLRLNALLGRANSSACTGFGNRTTATPTRRVLGDGKANQAVRARRAHKPTARRSTLARSANRN